MEDIPMEDLQALNTLNRTTWGWSVRADQEKGEGKIARFTILAVDPFTKTWYTVDGQTIKEATEKFIRKIEV